MSELRPAHQTARHLVLALAGICVGLLTVIAYLTVPRSEQGRLAEALQDSELRQQVVMRLAAESAGQFDAHADADVGRVHLANFQDREIDGISVSTNRLGLREREYALPKPEGTLRVVFLGDSMVYGLGVAAEDRMGAHLERWLRERTPSFEGSIECLHLGVVSWNFQSAAAYIRRQLSVLQPDLVVHVVVPNDVDDLAGVRGFGTLAGFSPQVRQRGDSAVVSGVTQQRLGFAIGRGLAKVGYLRFGLDYESQSRYAAARAELGRLAQAVEDAGGEYLLVGHYRRLLPVLWKYLGRDLEPGRVVYLSKKFGADPRYTLSKSDPHWNRAGHIRLAQLIYGLIVRDELLPALNLGAWDEASDAVRELADVGQVEAERDWSEKKLVKLFRAPRIRSSLDFEQLDDAAAAQIHGGIDRQGRVSPYASFLLRNPRSATQLRVEGQTFAGLELEGTRVGVFVDAQKVGEFEIRSDTRLALTYPLPSASDRRPFLSIRFESDNYIYAGEDLQRCVVFRLHRIELDS